MSLTTTISHQLEHLNHERNSSNAVSFYCDGVGLDVVNHDDDDEDDEDEEEVDVHSSTTRSTCSSYSDDKENWSDVDDEALMFVPSGWKSTATLKKTNSVVDGRGCNSRRYSHPITLPKLCHPRDDETMPSKSIVPIETTKKIRPPTTIIFKRLIEDLFITDHYLLKTEASGGATNGSTCSTLGGGSNNSNRNCSNGTTTSINRLPTKREHRRNISLDSATYSPIKLAAIVAKV